MGIPVLVEGRTGSGKTYSLKKFQPGEVGIISVEKGRLPFRTKLKTVRIPESFGGDIQSYAQLNAAKYAWIQNLIRTCKAKSIVIDDSQYLLVNELFDRAREKGYDKFTEIATNFRNLIHYVNNNIPDDKVVYFLHHTEIGKDDREKAKTVGKMLDDVLIVEGCFDIVLYCLDQKFYTQSDGQSTAKTPEDMFNSSDIPNDLKAVDVAIREYYGLKPNDKKEEEKEDVGEDKGDSEASG